MERSSALQYLERRMERAKDTNKNREVESPSVINIISWNEASFLSDILIVVHDVIFTDLTNLVFWVSIVVDTQTVSIAVVSAEPTFHSGFHQ